MIDNPKLYASVVYDTMRKLDPTGCVRVLSLDIRPLDVDSWCYGPAFTCAGRVVPAEAVEEGGWARLAICDERLAGKVVVLEAGDMRVAYADDIATLVYRQFGAAALVTNGRVRGSRNIRRDLPCFCAGRTPVDATERNWVIIDHEVLITLPGANGEQVTIAPGDFIFGDADGVIVIPHLVHEAFEEAVTKRLRHEQWVRAEIRDGPHDVPLRERIRQCFETRLED